MNVLNTLDPSTLPVATNVFTGIPTQFSQGCSTLYMMNKSNIGITIVFDNGDTSVLPAWYVRPYNVKHRSNTLNLAQAYTLPLQPGQIAPISQLFMEVYGPHEDTASLYSGPIPYQSQVSGSVTSGTTMTNASILDNEGNVAGSTILQTKVSGQTSFNQTMTNDGFWSVGMLIGGVITQWLKTQNTVNPVVIGITGKETDILGDLWVQHNVIANSMFQNYYPVGTINPSTGTGTISFVQPFGGGSFKLCLFQYNSFQNTGSAVNFTLPAAFTTTAFFLTTDIAKFSLSLGGGVFSCNEVATLNSSRTITQTPGAWTWGDTNGTGFDTIIFSGANASLHNGIIAIAGW